MWVVSKLLGDTEALGYGGHQSAEPDLAFGCDSEELQKFLDNTTDWILNYYPLWDAYRALMAYQLVEFNKRMGGVPVGDREEPKAGNGQDQPMRSRVLCQCGLRKPSDL